jgi:hypothetical protein
MLPPIRSNWLSGTFSANDVRAQQIFEALALGVDPPLSLESIG